jgi:hypothetical protein
VKPHLSSSAALRGQESQPLHEEAPATSNSEPATTNPTVQKTGQSVQAPNLNNNSQDLFRAFSVAQQIMAELKGAAFEEAKFVFLAKIIFKFVKENGNKAYGPLKIIAFNANGILRQRYELSKQLQDLHIDVALFSETNLKPHERFLFKIVTFTETIANREEKA